jgi:hypothetical protein
VVVVGWVASYPLSSQAPTPVEVELGCDNIVLIFAEFINMASWNCFESLYFLSMNFGNIVSYFRSILGLDIKIYMDCFDDFEEQN